MSVKKMIICDQCGGIIGEYRLQSTSVEYDGEDNFHVCRNCVNRNTQAGPWKSSGTAGKDMW